MLLRSSSTPILSSLLSSNESPNNHHHFDKAHPLKVSFHLSPLSDSSPAHDPSAAGFRRARSDGNLRSLLSSDHKNSPALDSIPSFSTYSAEGSADGDGEDEDEGGGGGVGGGFGFVGRDQNLNLVEELRDEANPMAAFPLFLARGLGIDRRGSGLLNAGGGGGGNGDGEGRSEVEMYYKRMVEENPSNALFLSNYAKFLYENKGDAQRAEEYYARAILADPGDGETLSQYAKLVWELHRDKERASSYFEQAVRATPNNSHVIGAYASFLWETGDEDEDGDEEDDHRSEGLFGVQAQQEALALNTGPLM